MPAKRNGPRSGKTFGNEWPDMPVKQPVIYKGTANGAKANAYRANVRYPNLRFRTFQENKKVFVERVQ